MLKLACALESEAITLLNSLGTGQSVKLRSAFCFGPCCWCRFCFDLSVAQLQMKSRCHQPGLKKLANFDPLLGSVLLTSLTRYFQIQEGELKTKSVTDPRAAVAVDVALLRAIPALPGDWLVSWLVYDVATGLVDTVVPPARIRPA